MLARRSCAAACRRPLAQPSKFPLTRNAAVLSRGLSLAARPATRPGVSAVRAQPHKFINGISVRPIIRTYASSKDLPAHTVISMPALSPTMTTGNIGNWHKKVGDEINPGDVLVEIETDKAQMDFECQEEGFLAKMLIETGAKDVPVNKPLAILVENKEDVAAFENYSPPESVPPPSPADAAAASAKAAPKEEPGKPPVTEAPSTAPASGDRIFASPLARTMALERGIPLSQLKGTGPEGRITKADVEAYKPTPKAAPAPAPAASVAAPAPVMATGAAYTDIPLTNMRKVIASRLTQSKQSVPHYYLTVEIEMDKLLKLREVLNSQSNGSYKLSVNDFIVKASAAALKEVPEVNAAWQDTFIRQFKQADVCVAVATESGLITPIVSAAETRGLASISNKIKELANKAKENKLKPEEYQGGSFTISNLGMFGIDHFTAIINPPQAAILAVGETTEKIVVDESSDKGWKRV